MTPRITCSHIASACRITNIAQNDVMILPYDANPGRMEFSERKRPEYPSPTEQDAG